MEIKNVRQTTIYAHEIKTSLKLIGEHVKVLPEKILEEINEKGLTITGPQVWVYNGADGNPDTVFDLTVGFPVNPGNESENVKILESFKCTSIIHKGDWGKFKETYDKIIGDVFKNGHQMTGESREIYHQVDFENTENNLTEIQIGIK